MPGTLSEQREIDGAKEQQNGSRKTTLNADQLRGGKTILEEK